jgi:hypothetical protein
MRKIFACLIATAIISCNDSKELYRLRSEVYVLQAKVDSLESVISLETYKEPIPTITAKRSIKMKAVPINKTKAKQHSGSTDALSFVSAGTKKSDQDVIKTAYSSPKKNYSKPRKSSSTQCHGITKKGYRCLRTVRGGGNCWQH